MYAVAVLLWLVAVFVLFLRTLVLARSDWFVAGAIGAGALVLAVLAVLGPDATIARRNLARAATHPFDAEHATRLAADAVPVLVAGLAALTPADACTVARGLLERWGDGSGDGLRSWNWSRAQAAGAVREHRAELQRACQPFEVRP